MLVSEGVLSDRTLEPVLGIRELRALGSVAVTDASLYEPFVSVGNTVAIGTTLGALRVPLHSLRPTILVPSLCEGLVPPSCALACIALGNEVFKIADARR